MEKVINFLIDLKNNNNREWFHANKAYYNEAKSAFEEYVNRLIPEIQKIDQEIGELTAKNAIFRIFRDVRFSKDKSPYKTNMGAFFAKGGRKSGYGGYYVHVEPGSSFMGGGIYMPPSDILKKLRTEIYNFPEDYIKITSDKKFKNTFKEVSGEKLKLAPKGFPKEFEHIELLKLKSYTVFKDISDKQVQDSGFVKNIIADFKVMKPFNSFLNRAVEEN